MPYRPELTWLRVGDLVRELNPEILNEGDLSRRIKDVAVLAQGLPGGVRELGDGRLIVVPGDRHDVIMAACLAAQNGTRLAALLLSAGIRPDPQIWQQEGVVAVRDRFTYPDYPVRPVFVTAGNWSGDIRPERPCRPGWRTLMMAVGERRAQDNPAHLGPPRRTSNGSQAHRGRYGRF